jgi:hypothetical protein
MRSQSRGKRVWITTALAFASLALAVPGVQAAKPTRTPLPLESTTLVAGTACPFDVTDTPLPGSKLTETVFSDGRVLITSAGRDQVTNDATGESVVLNTSGTVRFEERDGKVFIESTGHVVFFFLPGDQGPFGAAGEDGAYYHVIGHAKETLDLDQDLITSFSFSGRATELCGLIS